MPAANRYALFEGRILPIDEANISIMTSALHYGTAVFEGIRSYWSEERQRQALFRPRDHLERMARNARILHMELPGPLDEIEGGLIELLRREAFQQDAYVRPLLYKSGRDIEPRLHGVSCEFAAFAVPLGRYLDTAKGIRACVSSWERIHDASLPPRGKLTGAYVNSALAKSDAVQSGFDEAILLTNNGLVSEASAANLFLVRRGRLVTPPSTADILEGITRETVIELASEADIPVTVRPIQRTELYIADEVFLCGTATEVCPVIEIDHRSIGSGSPGPITTTLAQHFYDVVHAKTAPPRDWLLPIP